MSRPFVLLRVELDIIYHYIVSTCIFLASFVIEGGVRYYIPLYFFDLYFSSTCMDL